jgi:hypothetical protein
MMVNYSVHITGYKNENMGPRAELTGRAGRDVREGAERKRVYVPARDPVRKNAIYHKVYNCAESIFKYFKDAIIDEWSYL